TPEQIGLLRAWIDQGADWPDSASVKVEDKRQHWAFKAPARPPVPKVKNARWIRNRIDNFVFAWLDKEGLKPSPEADRATLCLRLRLYLICLPPTPTEVYKFIRDKSPHAYDQLVERL